VNPTKQRPLTEPVHDVDRRLADLAPKLARMARQLRLMRIDRTAAELLTLSMELHSAARHFRHDEPQA
jgi:hypothetical protein